VGFDQPAIRRKIYPRLVKVWCLARGARSFILWPVIFQALQLLQPLTLLTGLKEPGSSLYLTGYPGHQSSPPRYEAAQARLVRHMLYWYLSLNLISLKLNRPAVYNTIRGTE